MVRLSQNQNKIDKTQLQKTVFQILPSIVLIALALLFLHKLLSLEFITIGHSEDHLRLWFPYLTYDAKMLKSLTIPLWNPYSFCGFPYLASLRCHIFFPPNLIFLFMQTYLGMNINYMLFIFLSGVFMFGLGRELGLDKYSALISAVSFMFCGFMIDKVIWGQLTILGSACWLPLIYLLFIKAVERKKIIYIVGAGIIFAFQVFSGHPQMPYYGILSLSLFTIYMFLYSMLKKKPLKDNIYIFFYFILIIIVGIGLGAIQIIPAAELASHTFRSSFDDRFAFYTRWSMEPIYMVTFLLPRLTQIIGRNSFLFPVSLGYIGVLPLLLATLSLIWIKKNKYILFFWFLALFALILAAGRYTPMYYLCYKFVPGFDAFRIPIFLLYLYGFSMCILSGFGMKYFKETLSKEHGKRFKLFINIILIGCFLLVFIALVIYFAHFSTPVGSSNHAKNLNYFFSVSSSSFLSSLLMKIQTYSTTLVYDFGVIGFVVGLAVLTFTLWNRFKKNKDIPHIMIITLIFIELFLYGNKHIRVYRLDPFVSKSKWVDYLKEDKQLYRVLPILPYPEQDPVLKLNEISSINGYGSFEILKNYIKFIKTFQEEPVHQQLCIVRVKNYNSKAVNLLNTKYILTVKPILDDHFTLVFTDEIPMVKTWDLSNKGYKKLYVYRNKNAYPRALLVESFEVIRDTEKILVRLKEPEFDPNNKVILEKDPGIRINPEGISYKKGEVEFIDYKENEFTLKATPNNNCFLFLSEIYYPGWKAFVDNKPREIYKANYLFRAIYLEKGFHTIKFIFDPPSYKIGRILSLTSLLFLIIYLFYNYFINCIPKSDQHKSRYKINLF